MNFWKKLTQTKRWMVGFMIVLVFASTAYAIVREGAPVNFESIGTVTPGSGKFTTVESTSTANFASGVIGSQNQFVSFDIGGQNWGQPVGRMLNVHANKTLTTADSGKIFTDDDAGAATITYTLPVPEADLEFEFIMADGLGQMNIDPLAGDTILCDTKETASGATVELDTKGEYIRIVGVNANLWSCRYSSTIANLVFN